MIADAAWELLRIKDGVVTAGDELFLAFVVFLVGLMIVRWLS